MTASLTLIHHRLSHKHIRRRREAIFSSLQSFQSLCANANPPITNPVETHPRLLLFSSSVHFSLSLSLTHTRARTHTHTHTHKRAFYIHIQRIIYICIFYCSHTVSLKLKFELELAGSHALLLVLLACSAGPCTRVRVLYANAYLSYRAREPKALVITTLRRQMVQTDTRLARCRDAEMSNRYTGTQDRSWMQTSSHHRYADYLSTCQPRFVGCRHFGNRSGCNNVIGPLRNELAVSPPDSRAILIAELTAACDISFSRDSHFEYQTPRFSP